MVPLQVRIHAVFYDGEGIEEAGFVNGLIGEGVEEEGEGCIGDGPDPRDLKGGAGAGDGRVGGAYGNVERKRRVEGRLEEGEWWA